MPVGELVVIIISSIFALHILGMIILAFNEKDIEKDYNKVGHVFWILFGIFIIPLLYIPTLIICLIHKENFE